MEKIKAKLKTVDGRLITLDEESYRIGSFEGVCNYVIKSSEVSPIHAVIENQNGLWFVRDTNSAAGVRLNGTRIGANQPVLLNQQDQIEIDGNVLTIVMELDMLKAADVQIINDLYKNWLMSADPEVQARYKQEILRQINEKMQPLGVAFADGQSTIVEVKPSIPQSFTTEKATSAAEEKKQTIKDQTFQQEPVSIAQEKEDMATEVLNMGDEEEVTATDVLNIDDIDEDIATEVLNDDDDDEIATSVLSHDEEDCGTTVLDDDDGGSATTVLDEDEGLNATTVLADDSGSDPTTVLPNEGEGATMVLAEEGGEMTTVLKETTCVLERVNQNREKILIDANPFIIGKAQSQVNFCLDGRGISRRQARIFKNANGGYCIADLDSKNGTYVNGVRLQRNQEVEMRSGDMISFAEDNFIVNIG